MLRLKRAPGVGETQRVVHLGEVNPAAIAGIEDHPYAIQALCSAELLPGTFEVLDGPYGMPCVSCLRFSQSSPPPPVGWQRPAVPSISGP